MKARFLLKASTRLFTDLNIRIKSLRDLTGAPLMKCKEALQKTESLEDALNYLKQKNLIFAEKKANNEAKEGVFNIQVTKNHLQVIQVNSETDFVSRNDDFLSFVSKVSELFSVQPKDTFDSGYQKLSNEKLQSIFLGDQSVLEIQKLITAKIQEKIQISDIYFRPLKENDTVGLYVHKSLNNSTGPSVCFLVVESKADNKAAIREVAENLAVHAYCKKPKYITNADIPAEEISKVEASIVESLDDKIKAKGEDMVKKIISGKMAKHFDDDIMLKQSADFYNEELSVEEYLRDVQKQLKDEVKVIEYKIFNIK